MTTFLLDENLSPLLARWLRGLDYNVYAVRDVGLKGKSDREIVIWLQQNNAILITSDLDFGEFFYAQSLGSFGVVILRGKSQSSRTFERVLKNLDTSGILRNEDLTKSLVLATERNYRCRKFNRE